MVAAMFDLSPYPDAVVRGGVLALVGLLWSVALVRMIGARTLSKMTAFDFVVTLASASLLATAAAATSWTAYVQALVAMTTLLAVQYVLALIRRNSDGFRHAIENQPRLLMRNGRFLDDALRETRVARADIYAKLRQADVQDPGSVAAVILEATGDISILTDPIVASLLDDVRGARAG